MGYLDNWHRERKRKAEKLGLTVDEYDDYKWLIGTPVSDVNFQCAIKTASLKVLRLALEKAPTKTNAKRIQSRINRLEKETKSD